MPVARKFWNINKIKNNTVGELILYGEISDVSWWGDEVTPKQMNDELISLGDVTEINVHINSIGGDVFAGLAINAMLQRHKATIIVYIDGVAASIASIIAMAGDKIIMPTGSMMMIHNPKSGCWGDASDMRGLADVLDKVRDSLVAVYTSKTGLTAEELIPLLDAETWMSAEDAVAQGFADEVETRTVAASMKAGKAFVNGIEMDWAKFANAPKLIEDAADTPAETVEPLTDDEITAIRELLAEEEAEEEVENFTTTVLQTRNLDLEMKSLFLIEKTN